MAQARITIIGTGLIGTSIGLALAAAKGRTYEICGVDRDRASMRKAKSMGAIDRDAGSLEEALFGASVVFIAVPVMAARRIVQDMAPYTKPGMIITDVCSTKSDVMRWAAEYLPEGASFIGGHPMAGRETSGPASATAEMFQGATWAIAPAPSASEQAVDVVLGLVESMGALPFYIDPEEHDQWAAAVSHLPLIASVALFRLVRDSQGWEDAALIAGPGFRDMTRLASGDPTMSHDIMVTNRDAVIHWLGRFEEQLREMRKSLEEGSETLLELFASTQLDRDVYMTNPIRKREANRQTTPSAGDAMGRLLLGGMMYDKMKEIGSLTGEKDKEKDRKPRPNDRRNGSR